MDAYIDLSYIFSALIIFTLPYYYKRIGNLKFRLIEVISLLVLFLVLYFNAFIITSYPFINLFFLFIYFLLLYKRKVFKYYLIFLFAYYANIATIMIFSSHIYLFCTLPFLSNPRGIFYIVMELMNIIIIEIILFSIKSIKLLKNYRLDLMIEINGIYLKMKGYVDSGNSLCIENLPVVFLNERYFKGKYKEILVEGIGKSKSKYFKTRIRLLDREVEVFCASSNRDFKGCDCLLNIHLLEG